MASASRYTQHPLLRAYARALTPPDERDALFPRFADYYTTLADQFNQLPPEGWGALDDDLPNIHLTGDELVSRTDTGQSGDLQRAMTFAYNTFTYLSRRRQVRRIEWLEMGLNAARALPAPVDDPKRYRRRESLFLNELGGVWDALGEKRKALEFYERALPIRREVGDRGGEGTTLNNIGGVWSALGEKRKALEFYERALPIRREVGDRGGEAVTCFNIGMVYESLGDLGQAIAYVGRCVELDEQVEHPDLESDRAVLQRLIRQRDGVPEPQEDDTAQALAIMAQIYREKGEDALRVALKEAGMPEAVIEQVVALVKNAGGE